MMSVFSFLRFSLTDTGANCKLQLRCVCRGVCMHGELGGCSGSEWHRWHRAPAVPRASDRHVARSQPLTTYAKGEESE